jgi:uncharacterized protein (TIGR02453 family)
MFDGFSHRTIEFLEDLERNNNKAWFERYRPDYQEHLLHPFQLLVAELSAPMLEIDPQFETRPAIDKTLSRIYRDIRFSNDKSPFRPRMWLAFKRPSRDWKAAPSYFFELAPERYRYGMGFYGATTATMARLRELIDEDAVEWRQALARYQGQDVFHIEGESYKRVRDPDKPDHLQEWYQRKNIFLVRNRDIGDRLFHRDLMTDLESGFQLLASLYHFLRELTNVKD